MKRPHEYEIIEMAFEERSREVNLDSESARRIDLYRSLREELRAAAQDVPPPQLSNERLQHAILQSGLNQRSQRLSWAWATAPALGLVFGAILLQRTPDLASPPTWTNSNTRGELLDTRSAPVVARLTTDDAPTPPPSVTPVLSETSSPSSPSVRRTTSAARVSQAPLPSAPDLARDVLASDIVTAPRQSASTVEVPLAGVAVPDAGKTLVSLAVDEPTVVIIVTDTDTQTGSPIAFEVPAANHVVVGS